MKRRIAIYTITSVFLFGFSGLMGCEATVTEGGGDGTGQDIITTPDGLIDTVDQSGDVDPPDQTANDTRDVAPDVVETGACAGIGTSLTWAQYRIYHANVVCATWERCGVTRPFDELKVRLDYDECLRAPIR